MLKPWAETGLIIIYIFGFSIALVGLLFEMKKFRPAYLEARKLHGIIASFFMATFEVYKKLLAAVCIMLVLVVVFNTFGKTRPIPSPTSAPSITPTIQPTPSATMHNEIKLDELDPLRKDTGAFFIQEWNKFDPIKIRHVVYTQSIGICIPKKNIQYYYENHDTERKTHHVSIEYPLENKFKTLRFAYGIDDSSFLDSGSSPPQCRFRIVIQSCNSENEFGDNENVIYETPLLNYYCPLRYSGNIDVSNVEAIRITVSWDFDVIQSKPPPFNIAIVDPILSAVEN